MTIVASGMVAYTADMTTRALYLAVHLVKNDAGDAVIEMLFIPSVQMAGQTARIIARILAALVVTILALQNSVVRLQYPSGFGVIK
jgi:hypothetical protein